MRLIVGAVALEQFGVIDEPLQAHFALECDVIVVVIVGTGDAYLGGGVPVVG